MSTNMLNEHIAEFPVDEHDEKLVQNTHPSDWKNPKPSECYDLVVIGAGSGGLTAASMMAELGAKVAIIEKNLTGGVSLVTGCVPSKSIIRSSRMIAGMKNADEFAGNCPSSVATNFKEVMHRMRRIRARISIRNAVSELKDLGVEVFLGSASFTSPNSVSVGDAVLKFKKCIIATGSKPERPEIEGLEEAGYLTDLNIFNLKELPKRFAVIGGGPLGCELAQAFARLGSKVTIIQREPKFLPREERDAAQILAFSLARDGLEVRLNTNVVSVKTNDSEKILTLTSIGRSWELAVDEIAIAIGREPVIEGLHLEKAGVKYDTKKGITVDEYLYTTNKRILAIGDAALSYKFTHVAEATAEMAIRNAFFFGRRKFKDLVIPWCTYTDPEIAHVGMYVSEALSKNIPVKTYTVPLNDVDRAITEGEEQGFFKITIREGSDKIIGATVVSQHAGDLIGQLSVAITCGVGLSDLASVIFPYPTHAEAIKRIANQYRKDRLKPWMRKILEFLFKIRRKF